MKYDRVDEVALSVMKRWAFSQASDAAAYGTQIHYASLAAKAFDDYAAHCRVPFVVTAAVRSAYEDAVRTYLLAEGSRLSWK